MVDTPPEAASSVTGCSPSRTSGAQQEATRHLPGRVESRPMPSRRDLLKAGGGGLALAVAGGAARWGAWSPAVPSPSENAWPQPRYGPGNTGHSPDASPPRSNPAAIQRYDTGESANTVVVDEDRVYAGTEHSVWAYERGDDEYSAWDEPGDGRRMAVGSDAVVATGRGRVTV